MTLDEQSAYYANLLIIQYRNKPKAQATMQVLATQALVNNVGLQIQNAFNIVPALGPTAVGVQLDIIAKYVGVSRNTLLPLGLPALTDAELLTLIQFAVICNTTNSSLASIDQLLYNFFGTAVTVFDGPDNTPDMTLQYFINSSVGDQTLIQAILQLGLLPKPMGVGISNVIYAVGLANYFAFSSYVNPWPSGVSGFGSYVAPANVPFTGTTHSTEVIDSINVDAETALGVGYGISGEDIPAGTTIASLDSTTQIHISQDATGGHSGATLIAAPSAPWINITDTVSL